MIVKHARSVALALTVAAGIVAFGPAQTQPAAGQEDADTEAKIEMAMSAAPTSVSTEATDNSPSPEESAMAAEEARTIQSLLAQLSADQRQVVELRLAGLTDQEIAHVLGRSHGAIRTAHYRAVLQIRALFESQRGGVRHA